MLTGGCFCGRLHYEAGGTPYNATSCHCSMCRRFRSSAKASRAFCPECGTQLTFELDAAYDEIDVTTASLDEPSRVPPADHTYTASRLDSVKLADGLPQFRQSRQEG